MHHVGYLTGRSRIPCLGRYLWLTVFIRSELLRSSAILQEPVVIHTARGEADGGSHVFPPLACQPGRWLNRYVTRRSKTVGPKMPTPRETQTMASRGLELVVAGKQITPGREESVYLDGKPVGTITVTGDFATDQAAGLQLIKDKGLYRKIPKEQAMFRQAAAFGQTAQMLYARLRADSNQVLWAAPIVVNHVFAIEMLLKALATAHGATVARHHNLAKHFSKLPAAAHAAIDAAMTKRPAPPSGYTMETIMKNLAEAFTSWRYFFETGSAVRFNVASATWAASVLEQACIDSGVKL